MIIDVLPSKHCPPAKNAQRIGKDDLSSSMKRFKDATEICSLLSKHASMFD